jgi:DNA (cytosine-5)-methyltransferase 1
LIQTSYGEREGQRPRYLDLSQPLGTVVAGGIKHALVTAFLAKHFGGVTGVPIDGRPLDTVTSKDHHSLVMAFLTAYYGGPDDCGQRLESPTRTITTKDRLALVTVQGQRYRIEDIGMRMLEPEELLRAQFGSFAAAYDLSAAKTKTNKVRLIGNSVCPEVARAVIAANLLNEEAREAA